MPKLTNLCNLGVSLVLKSGEAVTLRAGETENVDYDPNHEHNVQMIQMGAVKEGGPSSDTAASRPAKKAAAKRGPAKRASRKG